MYETNEGDMRRLVEFLVDRDVSCPFCGYNLRNLTEEVCPECEHELRLTVGVHHVRFGWFLAAVTPSLVSGVTALLLLVLMVAALMTGGGPLPPVIFLLILLGLTSGMAGLLLILRRHRLTAVPKRHQKNQRKRRPIGATPGEESTPPRTMMA